MGRALKIQKTNNGVLTDAGYPNFGSLTDPVYNSDNTLGATEFLGVVGGMFTTSTPSATYPEIYCLVNITLANGTSTSALESPSQYGGRIIRQKGSHKFLVAYTYASTADEDMIVGQAYQIAALGTTNWQACGAPTGAAVGDVFTVTAIGSGTGTAYPVGQCVLSNTATPTAGNMSISYSVGDSTAVYASYITNKWVRDWNGMTYQNYSNSNYGTNVQSSENFYVANFFTDEGTVTWSGAEIINGADAQNGSLQLAQIASVTS
jgi:hypothetical protein